MEVYPALLGVGYIVGPRIASFMFVRFYHWMDGYHSYDLSVWTRYMAVSG